MALGGEETDRNEESRKASFHKSIICDVKELKIERELFADTNEGRLLEGVGGEDGISFFSASLQYVRRWRQSVLQGAPSLCELYELVQELAEEAHAFLRIKGCVRKILKSMKRHYRTNGHVWNIYTTAMVKTITTMKTKMGK